MWASAAPGGRYYILDSCAGVGVSCPRCAAPSAVCVLDTRAAALHSRVGGTHSPGMCAVGKTSLCAGGTHGPRGGSLRGRYALPRGYLCRLL